MLPESEIDYFMSEGCGIFAAALAKYFPESTIVLLCDTTGEQWSEEFPHEATHVCLRIKDALIDARGIRSLTEILDDFGINQGELLMLPTIPSTFCAKYMGNDDCYPLYGEHKDVMSALKTIADSGFAEILKSTLMPEERPSTQELGPSK